MHTRVQFFAFLLAVFVVGGANFQSRFGSNLVCLYTFTDAQATPGAPSVAADVSNSTFSPGSLQLGSTASWIPDSIGVRLAGRAPGASPGVGLSSTATLSNWTLAMRALQAQSPAVDSTFTVEMWLRSSNGVQTFAHAIVGFRNWSGTFAVPDVETLSYGMKFEDNVNMGVYATKANSSASADIGGVFSGATLQNSSSLMMVTLSYCKRVTTSVNFGDCYVNETNINTTKMAFCLTIRGGMNYTSCRTSTSTSPTGTRLDNTISFKAWSLSNMLQFAPFYSSNVSNYPISWAGDILLAAVYAEGLNGSTQAQNFAAGLPNSYPYVAPTANMSAFEDTLNSSFAFALAGYDFDNDTLSYDIVQLPSVGTLYNYNGTHFLPITGLPYRVAGAMPRVGYLQDPTLTYGRNYTTFTFSAWDGQANSRTNCTVTINVYPVNHVPYAFASYQVVNAQVPTGVTAFNCADPDAPTGDYVLQYCVATAPQAGGTFSNSLGPLTSYPYCRNVTTFQLLYTSLPIGNATSNVTDTFLFYCVDTFGTASNATLFYLYVQNSVWAVAGTSSGPENTNVTVYLLGTSNTTTATIQYQIVALPVVGTLYNGNGSAISALPAPVVNASGCVLPWRDNTYVQIALQRRLLCASAAHRRIVSAAGPTSSSVMQELHILVHCVRLCQWHKHCNFATGAADSERDARQLQLHGDIPKRCVCAQRRHCAI